MTEPFEFRQCTTLLKATGQKANTLSSLRALTEEMSENAIYHHTYQYFLKSHSLEYTNDFAQWAGEGLEERALAEELSNVDPYAYPTVDGLRKELMRVMQDYLARFPEPRDTRPGEEFYLNESVTLVFPAGVWARNLAEFLIAVKYVDRSCLYYHFYDSRLRTADRSNDFSHWLLALGKKEIAERVSGIDPFVHSLEGIREQIVSAVEDEVRKDMETAGVHHEAYEAAA
jgi:hypothetical protein